MKKSSASKKKSNLFPMFIVIAIIIGIILLFIFIPRIFNNESIPKRVNLNDLVEVQQKSLNDDTDTLLASLLEEKISKNETVLAFYLYDVKIDHIDYSPNKTTALIWLGLFEKDSEKELDAETGLAIAQLINSEWTIYLQADTEWNEILHSLSDDLISDEIKIMFEAGQQSVSHDSRVYTGYRLPWSAGTSRYLTGSVGHVFTYKTCPQHCLYAFDFADGTMFPVHAAKGGYVKLAVWDYPNGNTKHANYIVIEDPTTTPTTYQLYAHLAQGSIPVELRTPGARVVQGQFIGNVDDTGVSSGHHLHFHVHTNPASYFGYSVDIVFEDVTVNGGRPRTCSEAAAFPSYGSQCVQGNSYVSGNGDSQNPQGSITSPSSNQTIFTRKINITGKVTDDYGIQTANLLLNANGSWRSIGSLELNNDIFSYELDLCEENIQDGTFQLALDIVDTANKRPDGLPGLTTLVKNYSCPIPADQCLPGPNDVSFFFQNNYAGECRIFSVGAYPSISNSFESGETIYSIKLGSNVYLETYTGQNFEIFSDQITTSKTEFQTAFQSFLIQERPPVPQQPNLISPQNQQTAPLDERDVIKLTLQSPEENVTYRSKLFSSDQLLFDSNWTSNTEWEIDPLEPGSYDWNVTAINMSGQSSTELSFTVNKYDPPPNTQIVIDETNINSSVFPVFWDISEGHEDLNALIIAYSVNGSEWQSWKSVMENFNDPVWFQGQPGSTYQFRVQGIDYGGNIEPLDEQTIASISIPADCEPDIYDTHEQLDNDQFLATPLEFDETQVHNFCVANDQDWIMFSAEKDRKLLIEITSVNGYAAVKSSLFGIDYQLLAQYVPEDYNTSYELQWTAPSTGIYFLRLEPLDPRLSGTDVQYSLAIQKMNEINPVLPIVTTAVLPLLWLLGRALVNIKKFLSR